MEKKKRDTPIHHQRKGNKHTNKIEKRDSREEKTKKM